MKGTTLLCFCAFVLQVTNTYGILGKNVFKYLFCHKMRDKKNLLKVEFFSDIENFGRCTINQ